MKNRVTIVDLETTGLNREKDSIIEVAAVLFDVTHAEIIASSSFLIHGESNPAENINGISPDLLSTTPPVYSLQSAFGMLELYARHSDAFVAHRATFDRTFLKVNKLNDGVINLPFICTKFGCEWPRGQWADHLTGLALSHGVTVTGAHRALDDCLLLARVMQRVEEMTESLSRILYSGLSRGIGDPNKCIAKGAYGYGADRCGKYVRSYRQDVHFCPTHDGPIGWLE